MGAQIHGLRAFSGAFVLAGVQGAMLAAPSLARAEGSSEIPSALASKAPGQALPAFPMAPRPDVVRVFVTSDQYGAVFGSTAAFGRGPRGIPYNLGFHWPAPPSSDSFQFEGGECPAPCSVSVDLSHNPFRIVGEDIVPSRSFNLHTAPNGLDLHVHAGSWSGLLTGLTLSVLGAGLVLGGTGILVWEGLGEPPRGTSNHMSALLPEGVVAIGVGVVLAAIGIPLVATNRTRVDISDHSPASSPP
jgi:hypothetical protein